MAFVRISPHFCRCHRIWYKNSPEMELMKLGTAWPQTIEDNGILTPLLLSDSSSLYLIGSVQSSSTDWISFTKWTEKRSVISRQIAACLSRRLSLWTCPSLTCKCFPFFTRLSPLGCLPKAIVFLWKGVSLLWTLENFFLVFSNFRSSSSPLDVVRNMKAPQWR